MIIGVWVLCFRMFIGGIATKHSCQNCEIKDLFHDLALTKWIWHLSYNYCQLNLFVGVTGAELVLFILLFLAIWLATFAKVRQLYIICAVLVQLLGNFSAEAKNAAPSKISIQKETVPTISLPVHKEHSSDLKQPQTLSTFAFKIRFQRTVPVAAGWYGQSALLRLSAGIHAGACISPLYIPLIRFLLFPNHYFW